MVARPADAAARRGPRVRIGGVVWPALGLAAILAAVGTIVLGWSYYRLPIPSRPWDALHHTLGAGGSWGHALGIVGSGLMLINLLYLVRRRWARLERVGSMRAWLAFHVAAGIGGVALVLAHTGGDLGNPVARLSTIAAIVVLVTGVLGRWIYGQLDRGESGEETSEGELVGRLRAALRDVDEALWDDAQKAERQLSAVLPPAVTSPRAALMMMPMTPVVAVRLAGARRAVRRTLRETLDAAQAQAVIEAASKAVRYRMRARRQQGFKALIGAWRGVHRVATFVLILTLVAHVVTLYGVGGM